MQAPPTPPIHVPIVSNPPPFQPNVILTPEEFENLKRQVQLLRISQLRYIVQKYKLPANGNKSRLVQVVLNLFDAMRNTTNGASLLASINQDVLNIISSFHEPFTNPLEKKQKLSLQKPESLADTNFTSPNHPFICYPVDVNENGDTFPSPPLLGPIYALPGNSSGKFTFSIERLLQNSNANTDTNDSKSNDNSNEHKEENNNDGNNQEQNNNSNIPDFKICLNFAYPNNEVVPLDMIVNINCSQLTISSDDPFPLPIDITDFCRIPSQPNTAIQPNVKVDFISVQTQTAVAISISEYKLNTLSSIAANIYSVNEDSLVQQGPLKQQLQLDRPAHEWVEELAKQSYQPK